jgi:hypothetical protein
VLEGKLEKKLEMYNSLPSSFLSVREIATSLLVSL